MSENIEEQDEAVAVSEQPVVENQETQEDTQKMVPLTALQATRKRLQEAEAKAALYEEYLARNKEQQAPVEEEDPSALVERKHLKEMNAVTKREILETLYQDTNPESVQKINKYLGKILEKKPWLAESVENAQNRYARANEIVNDYMHLVEDKPKRESTVSDGQRIVQNANKPRSPVEMGKSARPTGTEYLKSIQGKKEFREYRQKLLRGEL